MRSAGRLRADPGVDRVIVRARQRRHRARSSRPSPSIPRDPEAVLALAEQQQIDLTVVGPEAPLARGIADLFSARGRAIFGPRRLAAQLETSKAFAKDFMQRHRVPTARYRVCGDAEDSAELHSAAASSATRPSSKPTGWRRAKALWCRHDRAEAEAAVRAAMIDRVVRRRRRARRPGRAARRGPKSRSS